MKKVFTKIITMSMMLTTMSMMLFSSGAQKIGTTSAMFKPTVSPKVNSLGGAYSTFSDADSLLVNPAGISRVENKEISLAYTRWLVETSYGYLSFVIPVSNIGSFGFAVDYFDAGSMDRVDQNGSFTGEKFNSYGILSSLVYSRNINEKLSIGAGVKYITQTIDDKTASTPSLDLGTLFVINEKLKLAVVAQNLFGSVKFVNEEDKLPLVFKTGGSYKLTENLITAVDINVPSDNNLSVNAGVEYSLKFNDFVIPIRAGYKSGVEALLGISLGAGVVYKNIVCINFCWTPTIAELEQQTFNAGLNFKF